jgi:hypothetical protein
MGDDDSEPRAFRFSDLSDYTKAPVNQGFCKALIDQGWTTV